MVMKATTRLKLFHWSHQMAELIKNKPIMNLKHIPPRPGPGQTVLT